jgi:hypothetical protein
MGRKAFVLFLILGLLLAGCSGKGAGGAATNSDIPGALNIVLGSADEPSVYSSYHLELTLDTPQVNDEGTAVVNQVTQISADVEGANVHIVQLDPGETETKEGYIIGDSEYKMVDGQKQEMMGQIALSWAMWPLQVILPYAYASYYAEKTSTDTIGGRDALVYTFDSASAPAVSDSMMDSFGLSNMANASGTVWIDKQTGGMLKLDMIYTETLKNSDDKEVGTGSGSVKLEITQVGEAHVVEP